MLLEFEFLNVIPVSEYKEKVEGLPFEGMVFVLTGSYVLEGRTVKRHHLEQGLKELGAEISGSVSSKTTAVIKGNGGGEKATKASSLGVPVVKFEDLHSWLSSTKGDERPGDILIQFLKA